MFYEGDLQSGIALAVREAKQVICFVRDDGEESIKWRNEYLADEEISHLLASKTVPLQLTAGSQEAGFLSSFCPINKVPTLVVIKNGVLREYIVSGTSEDEFKRRLKTSLEDPSPDQNPPSDEQNNVPQSIREQPSQTPVLSPATPNTGMGDAELPTDQNDIERRRRESVREGKRRADLKAPQASENSNEGVRKEREEWKQRQRKKKQQEREERERVLNLIKHDHKERKAKEEQRNLSTLAEENFQPPKPLKTAPQQFRLQVRLFDGSSIRNSFSPNDTVRANVRPWIDSQRSDGDVPYTLKHILSPLPNRTISVSEEDQSLSDLSIGPTATLVMVPIRTYTEAYTPSASSIPFRVLSGGYGLVAGTVGAVAETLGNFLGIGQVPPGSSSNTPSSGTEPTTTQTQGRSTGQSSRPPTFNTVRTLHDSRAEQDKQQFYNGNQLNFEPRKKPDGDD